MEGVTTYSCTRCRPVDTEIIEAYLILTNTSKQVSAQEADRVTAEQGRVTAENERERVFGLDHGTATDDHATAVSDHGIAVADHGTAGDDHTLAAGDHVTAGEDHLASTSATSRANDAAAAAEHMVDIHQGPPGPSGKAPVVGANGNWWTWDDETEAYVDSGEQAQGPVGATPDISIGTVTTGEPGDPASASMGGTAAAPILNLTIPKGQKGDQGNTGSSVAYPYELVNNETTDDATKGHSAAGGKRLNDKINQLEAKVGEKQGGTYPAFMTLEQGAISSSTGADSASNTRIRTQGYIYADVVNVATSGSKVYVMGYKEDGTFIDSVGWKTVNTTVQIAGAEKYRFVFAKSNDGSITPSGYDSLGVSVIVTSFGKFGAKEVVTKLKQDTALLQPVSLNITPAIIPNVRYYLNAYGYPVYNSDYGYTNAIPVSAGQRLKMSGVGNNINYFVYCDQDGVFISEGPKSTGIGNTVDVTFSENGYIRLNGRIMEDGSGLVSGLIWSGSTVPEIDGRLDATRAVIMKVVSCTGSSYNKHDTVVEVVFGTLSFLNLATNELATITDSNTYTLSATNGLFLVLAGDGTIKQRLRSTNIQDSDFVLLALDNSTKDINGGALFTDYVKYSAGDTSAIAKQVQIYVSTRGAVYTRDPETKLVTVRLNTLFVYNITSSATATINDSNDYLLSATYRFLVLAGDGTIKQRARSASLQADDFVLLYYDDNAANKDIVAGALYADYIKSRVGDVSEISMLPENLGQVNCVRKAKQMALFKWTPKLANTIPYNNGTFPATEQEGLIYSSVKEYNQFVFEDVSLETFMTAVNNSRSVLYTEKVSASGSQSAIGRTYHGVNCAAYYGSVCSGLLTFAYGLPKNVTTYEFRTWDRVEVIQDQSAYGCKIGDAVWTSGHIQLITGITKDKYGIITEIELVENSASTTRVKTWTTAQMDAYLVNNDALILRYKDLYANRNYTPLTDFVAVDGETLGTYTYNDDICPDYGDKSNYNEGDSVVLNLRTDYASAGFTTLEVYKDDVLLISRAITGQDETLTGLAYGDYKARITGTGIESGYAYFKVVNAVVAKDGDAFNFSSANATPVYYEFCDLQGRRSYDIVGLSTHTFTDAEILAGSATPSGDVVSAGNYHYLKVHYQTVYGRVIKVIDWNA